MSYADDFTRLLEHLIAEQVAPLEQRVAELERERVGDNSYLTTIEYANRYKTTPGAVLARIHRGTLHAIRPPGSREWLIPEQGYDGTQ